jgi:two-component system phosphate regulon sensor histidine kinase PhoR
MRPRYLCGVKRNRQIPWFLVVMVTAFLAMSTVQVLWLRDSVQLKHQLFDDNVEHALSQVADRFLRPTVDLLTTELESMPSPGEGQGSIGIHARLDARTERMLARMDAFRLDSLVSESLKEHGIQSAALVGVFDAFGQPIRVDDVAEPFLLVLSESPYTVRIDPVIVRVVFPHLRRDLLQELWMQFVLTGGMLAIIAIGFFRTVVGANRNKRIDRIRRDLMNNLTHELKTPISTIGLAAEALGDPDMRRNEDSMRHYTSLIREESKRLTVLVENVLQASLADSGAMRFFPQPLNVHDVLKEVVRTNAIQIHKRGGRVELVLEAANPVVDADKIHMTNVAYNLMDNAMKYAKSHPHLVISTAQLPDGLMIKFKDNGIGIAKEHLGKVFDRLYRVPTGNVHDVKGFGLGLSYVKTVVERHGGEISVESEPGKGSTFIVRLPRQVAN